MSGPDLLPIFAAAAAGVLAGGKTHWWAGAGLPEIAATLGVAMLLVGGGLLAAAVVWAALTRRESATD